MTAEVALRLGRAVAQRFRHPGRPRPHRDRQGHAPVGLHARERAAAGIVSMGADVMLVRSAADAGDRLHHLVDARRRRRGDQRVAQPVSGQRHQDLRRRRLQAARRGRGRASSARMEAIARRDQHARGAAPDAIGKAVRIDDAVGRYVQFLKHAFPKELTLDGLKVVVDCANGAAYHVAPQVFEELGAEVIALNVWPDGRNINDDCGALHPGDDGRGGAARGRRPRHRARRRRRSRHPRRREGADRRRRPGHGDLGTRMLERHASCRSRPWWRR